MVTQSELRLLAQTWGVPVSAVWRDYVLGWLLWGIFHHPALAPHLVLKGGNCLRKVYLPETRLSADLDFTTRQSDIGERLRRHLPGICRRIATHADIPFDLPQIRIVDRATPDADCRATEVRVYFQGLARSIRMRAKFDISAYEAIALPLQYHPLRHPFSDAAACQVTVQTYSLEEVLAEKLRSWIQRTRTRDLYDIVALIDSAAVPIVEQNIRTAFWRKTIYKAVPWCGRQEMLYAPKLDHIRAHWSASLLCPRAAQRPVEPTILRFQRFIERLFAPTPLPAGSGVPPATFYNAQTGFREAIIAAGRARQLVRVRYGSHERNVEPYSFRFKQRLYVRI